MAEFTPIHADEGFIPIPADKEFTPEPAGFTPVPLDDPSIGEIGTGLAVEVGGGIGGSLGGAIAGTAIAGPIGTIPGAIIGGATTSFAASIAAQRIEGREDISWGRALAAGLIGSIPFGFGKGGKVVSTVGKAAAREAGRGAAFGATDATLRATVDEGRLPTFGELSTATGAGAALGGSIGAVGNKIVKKFGGKGLNQIDEDIGLRKIEFKYFKPILGKVTPELEREFNKTREAIQSKLAADAINSRNLGKMGKILASVAPSRFIGERGQQAAIDYKRMVKTFDELGSRIARQVERISRKNPEMKEKVNRVLDTGKMDESIKGQLGADLKEYESLRKEAQRDLLSLIDEGAYKSLDEKARATLRQTILDSISDQPYTRRDYRMYTDKTYTPSKGAREAAKQEIAAKRMAANARLSESEALNQAEEHLNKLDAASAKVRAEDPRSRGGQGLDSILKKRHNPGIKEREYLGEITDPGERIRGTLSALGRSVARERGDIEVSNALLESGIASRSKSGDMVELVFRGSGPEGSGVYANPEVQVALNNIYLPRAERESANIFLNGLQDLYRASVAGSKAAKVLLNTVAYPVQLYGNTATLLGMGINPFRGARRGLELALAEFGGVDALIKSPAARSKMLADIREMSKYGIKNANIIESDIRDTLSNGIFSKALNKVTSFFGRAYSVPDTMGRYVGWKQNMRVLRKQFPEASDVDLKKEAARLINDTYQNYDKLSNTVRTLSRWGIIPQFASFTAEFMRNQYNQGRVITQMMRGTYGAGNKALGPANLTAMRAEATKRLASLTAVYGATVGAIAGAKKMSGVDEDTEDALRDVVYAPWDKNRDLMVHLNKDGDTGWTANMSYISPHALGWSALRAGMNGEDQESLVGLLAEEMIGEGSFVFQEIFHALANKNKSGKDITNELNNLKNAQDRATYFIRETFKPGFSRELKKFNDARLNRGDLTLKEVGARQLGLRSNPFNIDKQSMFTMRGNNEVLSNAKRAYTNLKKYREPTAQELEAQYRESNRLYREAFDALVKNNNSLAVLGRGEGRRIELMKDAGVSSSMILQVLDGQYKDLPRVEVQSISDIYDSLPDGSAKLPAIRSYPDKSIAKKLLSNYKREVSKSKRKLTPKENLILNMGIAERADYISKRGESFLTEMKRKGIATPAVVEIINKKK